MRIGIDASNISSGGGLNHFIELLRKVSVKSHGISLITIWACQKTLDEINDRPNLEKKSHPYLNGGLLKRWLWQKRVFDDEASRLLDVLFVPGGSYTGSFKPFVTMNQNLLPFDLEVRKLYGVSFHRMRLYLLEKKQSATFRKAEGVIFLSENALRVTENTMSEKIGNTHIIPHGISSDFFCAPRPARPIMKFSEENPFRITYTSTISVYKYQWNVIEAVSMLRKNGFPVVLDFIGKITTKKGGELLKKALSSFDPAGEFVNLHGNMSHSKLKEHYKKTDLFVFASSCETFGQILLEAMASGMPIACSDRSAMPEILNEAGVYFDPEDSDSISESISKMLSSEKLREESAHKAFNLAKNYSWERCARETFEFITQTVQKKTDR